MAHTMASLAARCLRSPSGCLVWQGKRHHTGYGLAKVANRRKPVHRLMYEATFGPIPDGLLVLHRCDNRPCIEPTHLFLGTDRDNVRDMFAKGRAKSSGSAALAPADLVPFAGQRHWRAAQALGVSAETVRDYRREWRAQLRTLTTTTSQEKAA